MSKNKITSEIDKLNAIPAFSGSNWNSIKPEYAARMRLQNQFKSGIDIAKYTASVMRKDMDAYDSDTSAYTQSLGCWHGFIGQQKLISIKKHFGTTDKKYLYLSGWMVAALRSEFGPLPDQSMHEKTSVASLIKELYTFLDKLTHESLVVCLESLIMLPMKISQKFKRKSIILKLTLCQSLQILMRVLGMRKPPI
jgi:isocitrate lyase